MLCFNHRGLIAKVFSLSEYPCFRDEGGGVGGTETSIVHCDIAVTATPIDGISCWISDAHANLG